ncbi:MAG: HDOD domain-containing protein [Mariprofundaceae bacterium]
MDSELENRLMAMVDEMPPFPKSIHRVIELTNDLNCAPKDLVQVIEHDPVITMKLLKLVNSAYYALNKSVSSVRHAVVYLGLNTVKNLALSIATVTALPRKNCRGFNTNHFLLHSMTTASISQRLAKEYLKRTDSTELFVGGLLHDFGKVVFVQSMPEEFSRAITMASDENITLHDAEMEVIGANHTEVGAMLSEKWQLPSNLATGIRNHHTPDIFDAADDCVFAADQISKKLQFGFSGNPIVEAFPEHVVQRFGMDLDGLIESLGDMSDEVDKAESFILM